MDSSALPPSLLSSLPAEVVALLASQSRRIAELEVLVAEQSTLLAELQARLAQNSSNSSRPPSADPPSFKRPPPNPPSGRKPGGQPGHARHERRRLTPTTVVDHRPRRCSGCHAPLAGDDPDPAWSQTWELPEVRPHVTEHRFHRLACPCGRITAAVPPGDPATDTYGPRLKAAVAYLTGVTHLSKAQAQDLCEDLFGLPISTGQVCAIEAEAAALLAVPLDELRAELPKCHANLDETGWKQSGQRHWLWVAVTATFTLFHLARSRGRQVVEEMVGPGYAQVATTDRWSAYNRLGRRQLCWAHLRRDFQAAIDRGGSGKGVGEDLLGLSDSIFSTWKRIRDGTLSRRTACGRIRKWFGPDFEAALEAGLETDCGKTRALCGDLLAKWDHLWTFIEVEGVEPTNNAAERALRPAVLWRKRSQGTRCDGGSRYVAGMLSVATTCKQQGRRVWAYLTQAFAAAKQGNPAPSLLLAP